MCRYKDFIAVTNRKLCGRPFAEQMERVCALRPAAVILREKDLTPEEYGKLGKTVLEICRSFGVDCIYHTFAGEAVKAGVRRIHLPLGEFEAMAVGNFSSLAGENPDFPAGREGRPPAPKGGWLRSQFDCIGVSVHSAEEALRAQALGASYVTAGHIYTTDCKKGVPPRGLDFLEEVCRAVDIPVWAIGGIGLGERQLAEVKARGAKGACVMSGMMRV